MGNRTGQGYGRQLPKRKRCDRCGKKGMTQWKATQYGLHRDCQYCKRTENKPLGGTP